MNAHGALSYYAALTALAIQWPSHNRFNNTVKVCADVYDNVLPPSSAGFTFGTFLQEVTEVTKDGVK